MSGTTDLQRFLHGTQRSVTQWTRHAKALGFDNWRFYYNLLTAQRNVSNTYAQVAQAQSCANHVQHIKRLSRATCQCTKWYEETAQLLSLTEL